MRKDEDNYSFRGLKLLHENTNLMIHARTTSSRIELSDELACDLNCFWLRCDTGLIVTATSKFFCQLFYPNNYMSVKHIEYVSIWVGREDNIFKDGQALAEPLKREWAEYQALKYSKVLRCPACVEFFGPKVE